MTEVQTSGKGISRRGFLKTTAAAAGAAALCGGLAACASEKDNATAGKEVITVTTCRANCSQSCHFEVHTRDGVAYQLTPMAYETDEYTGCCIKGLSIQERTYSSNRVKYPMRRKGERGADEWERISWETAIEEITTKMKEIQAKYGNQALMFHGFSGNYGLLSTASGLGRRFMMAVRGTYDGVCADQAFKYSCDRMMGAIATNEPIDAMNSRYIIVWGANPVWSYPQTWRIWMNARDNGTKIVVIDPLYTATAAMSDYYIPVTPGTDTIISMALINKILSEGKYDEAYCQSRTTAPCLIRRDTKKILRLSDLGVLEGATDDYMVMDADGETAKPMKECANPVLFGTYTVDGIVCDTVLSLIKESVSAYTFDTAVKECGISAENMEFLYEIYTQDGPVWTNGMYGIDHYFNGHLWAHCTAILCLITGNVGKPGATFGTLFGADRLASGQGLAVVADPDNPGSNKKLSGDMVSGAMRGVIKSGKYKGKDYPIKSMLAFNGNVLSNIPAQKELIEEVFPLLELIVTIDVEFNDTARYSDYVLPSAFWIEQDDGRINAGNPYVTICEKAIEPLFEAKSNHETFTLLAKGMGLEDDIPEQTAEEWIKYAVGSASLKNKGITYDLLKEKKAIRVQGSSEKPVIQYETKFSTTSGRAELYIETPKPRYDWGQDWKDKYFDKEHLPYYEPAYEVGDKELAKKYPLQFLQIHTRWMTHTQWYGNESMHELSGDPLMYLSPNDAKARGIEDGDIVRAYNDRGSVTVRCFINNGVQDGIAVIPKGRQRNQFIAGGYQELTHIVLHPMSVNYNYYDVRCEVEKVK